MMQENDSSVLEHYLRSRDEAAFEVLVHRHGPLVMGVCRRVLGHHQDAEDAFQHTFLILAQRAQFLRDRKSLSSWLYGVALRVSQKAKTQWANRIVRERQNEQMKEKSDDHANGYWPEVEPVLDREIERLPAKYREPLLLCLIQGKSSQAAADELGWPIGTVTGRLSRARSLLQSRLVRLGLVPASLPFGPWLEGQLKATPVSEPLVRAATQTAYQAAQGASAMSQAVAPEALDLADASWATAHGGVGRMSAMLIVGGVFVLTAAGVVFLWDSLSDSNAGTAQKERMVAAGGDEEPGMKEARGRRLFEELRSVDQVARADAEKALLAEGDTFEGMLKEKAGSKDPDTAQVARRMLGRIMAQRIKTYFDQALSVCGRRQTHVSLYGLEHNTQTTFRVWLEKSKNRIETTSEYMGMRIEDHSVKNGERSWSVTTMNGGKPILNEVTRTQKEDSKLVPEGLFDVLEDYELVFAETRTIDGKQISVLNGRMKEQARAESVQDFKGTPVEEMFPSKSSFWDFRQWVELYVKSDGEIVRVSYGKKVGDSEDEGSDVIEDLVWNQGFDEEVFALDPPAEVVKIDLEKFAESNPFFKKEGEAPVVELPAKEDF